MTTVLSTANVAGSSGQTMPTQATLDPENVTNGDNENHAPPAKKPFQEAWNRLLSPFTPRRHVLGKDQTKRGETTTAAESTAHDIEANHGEIAVAAAKPPDGSQGEAANHRQESSFGSTAFDHLPQPVPVVDIFFGSWWLVSALRTATRPVVIYQPSVWIWTSVPISTLTTILEMNIVRWALLKAGHDTIPLLGVPIPGKLQLFRPLMPWIQKIWVIHGSGYLGYHDR